MLFSEASSKTFYDFNATTIKEQEISLSQYKGKVLLIVNVASKCGFTNQYTGLEKLYKKYKAQNFEILAFPSNQFNEQEPGTAKEIQEFCEINYGITFPLFKKINVNGEKALPLFKYLKKEAKGFLGTESIKWNFTKFLVNKKGKVVARYGSTTKPKELDKEIKKLLN
jgi:glutathione peroxidase